MQRLIVLKKRHDYIAKYLPLNSQSETALFYVKATMMLQESVHFILQKWMQVP